jgi:Protein of unknown function (DUF1553)/Protein of unknown function (DUF1549)
VYRVARLLFIVAAFNPSHAQAQTHWSFKPRTDPVVPSYLDAASKSWARTNVDAFVLRRLQAQGLKPAPQAERAILIRRLYFDLTGLPPTPAEVAAFVQDSAPDAYERLVERLLSSPRYGERWALHWLDVVRYAESDGFEYDRYRPGMWRYRDYVIAAVQNDKPYDRFVLEQIAGDLLDTAKSVGDSDSVKSFSEGEIAAGFHRLGPVRRNAGNAEVAFSRNEVLTDITDAVGMVFMGLTVGCARCHDHKVDDFSQEDYYRLQAFMAGTHEYNPVLADKETQDKWQKNNAAATKEIKELRTALTKADGTAKEMLTAKLKEAESKLPPALPTLCTIHELPAKADEIHVLKRGMPEKKGQRVEAGFPAALVSAKIAEPVVKQNPRLALANWLVDLAHPLTARVYVNRVWQGHFGRGLVETANDFGVNGAAPSHPELLDYLANEFIRQGMQLKPLHRLIVLSSTYRQSSRSPNAMAGRQKDPGNRLLWQFPRRRLSAEEVRDTMLAVAGRLNLKAGGESVVLPVESDLTDQLYDPSAWPVTLDPREHDRRSIYLLAKRNLRLPFGQVFDQPDLQISCPRRETSTHALQALELMNGRTSNRLADTFAERLQRDGGKDRTKQVELAYHLAIGRAPTAAERDLALAFLERQPLREFALAMFNVNGFLYVD